MKVIKYLFNGTMLEMLIVFGIALSIMWAFDAAGCEENHTPTPPESLSLPKSPPQ